MELEIYEAFLSAGVKEDKAKAAVESINKEIDKRYTLHAEKLATKGDIVELQSVIRANMAELKTHIADTKAEIIKWAVGCVFASVGMFAAIVKLLG